MIDCVGVCVRGPLSITRLLRPRWQSIEILFRWVESGEESSSLASELVELLLFAFAVAQHS